MRFDYSGATPLYRQVAEQLSDAIASGAYAEGDQIPSTTEISVPTPQSCHRAQRHDDAGGKGLMEKRRGIGMFVVPGHGAAVREANADGVERDCVTRLVAMRGDLDIGVRSWSCHREGVPTSLSSSALTALHGVRRLDHVNRDVAFDRTLSMVCSDATVPANRRC